MKPKIEINDNKVKVTILQNKIIDWLIKQNNKRFIKQLQKQGIIPKQGVIIDKEMSTQTFEIIIDYNSVKKVDDEAPCRIVEDKGE